MKKKLLISTLFILSTSMILSGCGESGGGTTDPVIPGPNKYLITFKDENGNILEAKNYEEDAVPSYTYSKEDTAEWDYTFIGWSTSPKGEVADIEATKEDKTYYAVVTAEKKKYDISFYDTEGGLIKTEKYEYGVTPSCDFSTPADTAEWDYTFAGWATISGGVALSSLPVVIGEASYYAVVNKVKQRYKVLFNDENGNKITEQTYEYGEVPAYTYVKDDTAEWDYTVHGWSSTKGGEVLSTLPSVSGAATYYAVVTKTKRSYTVTFKDENQELITSGTYEYGSSVSCSYAGPSDTQQFDYTFKGWSTTIGGSPLSSLPTVTGDVTYYAVVEKETQKYAISFFQEDGETLIQTDDIYYGATPSCSYVGPSDNQEWDYTFKGWSTTLGGSVLSELPTVSEAATYYAVVDKVKKQYTISFVSNGGSTVTSITKDYGTSITKPTNPSREGYKFVCWTSDINLKNKVEWPYTITDNVTFYAKWNELIDMKGMLATLMEAKDADAYSFIPDTMLGTYSQNHLTDAQMNYDFTSFTNVSDIHYGGYGEQWNMILENLEQSELFYSVLTLGETVMNASVAAFNNYFDGNPDSSADHSLSETTYSANINYANDVLSYTIQYKTNLNIPFFGNLMPQVDMSYDLSTGEKAVRIQLSENNAMRYVSSENSYTFAIEYGVEAVNRKAIFMVDRDEEGSVEGHIYEFIQLKDKDMVPSCADFYIDDDYVSVVGNKAGGLVGFKGYINELYEANQGKLVGYKVQEELTFAKISSTYHTLWFNLNNISNISTIKAVENENFGGSYTSKNPHDIYLNGSASIFEPTYNYVTIVLADVKTSRKYDIELRKQYFFNYDASGELVKHECDIPMMFIQDNHDSYTNYDDFESDIYSKSGIAAQVTLDPTLLAKIRNDYNTMLPEFKNNVSSWSISDINDYIGSARDISQN